jgi:hypothetical protein
MIATSQGDGMPTVSRVVGDAIVELVYDPAKRKTALAVFRNGRWSLTQEFRTSEGERLVPYGPDNNLIRHGCILLPSRPDPDSDKAGLLRDIGAYLHAYVDLSPLFARLAAHYVLLTWIFDAFNELPYLRFQGDFGSGKTRALLAVGSIVYKGFFASGASTVSPVFHTLDAFGGTLVLDEADLRQSGKTADLVKILNNGTVKGLPVLRSVPNRHKEYSPAAFTVFGPKIVAMRGGFRDEALESRFLTEEMGTRPLRPDVPIRLPDRLKDDAVALRNRLLHFRFANLAAVRSDTTRLVAGIDPRLNQMALSLAALIDDPELLQSFEALLRTRDAQLATQRARSLKTRTISALSDLFRETPRPFVPLSELAARVNAGADAPATTRDLGRILRAAAMPLYKSDGHVVVANAARR